MLKVYPRSLSSLFEGLGRGALRHSCLLGAEIVAILVIAVSLDILASRANLRFDLTPAKEHSLSPLMQKVVQALDREMRVTVFYQRGERDKYDDLLSLMAQENPLFSYRLFDLDRTPGLAQEYEVSDYGEAVVETSGDRIIISHTAQPEILNALLRLSQPVKNIYFVSGHGERSLMDRQGRTGFGLLKMMLETENYQILPLSLSRNMQIPGDAHIVVVGGPREEFLPDELASFSTYLTSGGRAIFMIDPYTVPDLCLHLARFGFVLEDGVVVDTQARLTGGDPLMPVITNSVEKVFPRELKGPVLMPLARPVGVQGEEVHAFAFSSPDSWTQHNRERIRQGDLQYRAGEDTPGPVPVAAVATVGGLEGREGKVVVLGDSDFVTNFYIRIPGNMDLFMNTVGWLVGREELVATGRAVEVPVAGRTAVQSLYITQTQARLFFWIMVILEPSLIFVVGASVFLYRRRRG